MPSFLTVGIRRALSARLVLTALLHCTPLCRLDKSVNTLTIKRALLALPALWHRMPFNPANGTSGDHEALKDEVDEFYEEYDESSDSPREHTGIFEGSALSGVIVAADKGFDWDSLPADAGAPHSLAQIVLSRTSSGPESH